MNAPLTVGTASDGQVVQAARLAWPGGLEAEVWSRGAMLRSLTAPLADGRRAEVLQAPADLAAAEADEAYHDLVIGPVANRIAGARFVLEGRTSQLAPNEGQNLLHSGAVGWSRVGWRFIEASNRRCVLEHRAPASGGYPADIAARVTVALAAADTLEIAWEAQVSRPAPVAMTHHLYFNLSAGAEREVLGHELRVAAPAFTPVGPGLIPTGEMRPVEGSPFDLRRPRRIADVLAAAADHPQLRLGSGGLDLNWVLDREVREPLSLRSPASGLELHLATDQPGVQLYSGQTLKPPFVPFSALAIEPQDLPNAVNQPNFPPVVMRPGAPYRRTAHYRFAAGEPGPPRMSERLRVMTYNVHGCVGVDKRLDLDRVAAVIAREAPDLVALQELDVGRLRSGGVDQARAIAARLGMNSTFNAAFRVAEEEYGDALLSPLPMRLVRAGPLPAPPPGLGRLERRGAQWVALELPGGGALQAINTHLGLVPLEQRGQVETLLNAEWAGAPAFVAGPSLLLGDFNATSRYAAYRRLSSAFSDLQRSFPAEPVRTFPARLPMLRIDHVFAAGAVRARECWVPNTATARIASDHLPLVMDLEVG